jgi:hypothetical protein
MAACLPSRRCLSVRRGARRRPDHAANGRADCRRAHRAGWRRAAIPREHVLRRREWVLLTGLSAVGAGDLNRPRAISSEAARTWSAHFEGHWVAFDHRTPTRPTMSVHLYRPQICADKVISHLRQGHACPGHRALVKLVSPGPGPDAAEDLAVRDLLLEPVMACAGMTMFLIRVAVVAGGLVCGDGLFGGRAVGCG